jgi:hypothetical protein
MKITCYAMSTKQTHQVDTAKQFINGLKRHDVSAELKIGFSADSTSDLTVVWGMRGAKIVRPNKDFLLMERSYFEDRFKWISLGYNDLNNRGEFYNTNMPSDRWNKHFNDGRMKEWNPIGDHVLLTLQIRGDNSLNHVNVNYQQIVNEIRKNTDLPIYVRDHPHRKNTWGKLNGVHYADTNIPIAEAIRKAKVVVTINSNSGVDAILEGTPVLNIDHGSMVWDLAMQNDFSNIDTPPIPNREQWAYDTSYCQWLPSEIENGDAWAHLKQRYS